MDILITRHGQTEWNVLKKVQGKADIDLNKVGENQALITANNLNDEKIDLIISSPLKRALQTAKIINKTKNIPIIIDERISERDFGEFEGKATSSFDFEEFWSYRADKKYLKAENIRDFFERVYSFLDELQEKYNNMRILIVTHAGVSIPMKCYFNEIPDLDTLLPLAIENCEVYKIQNIHQIIGKQKK